MDLKYLAILTFIVSHMVSFNITLAAGGTDEEGPSAPKKRKTETKFRYPNNKPVSALGQVGHLIVRHLPRKDLKSLSKAIPMMSEHMNHELNRRRRILHYRDGEINPPYLKNALKHQDPFAVPFWKPYEAILFGSEKPINMTAPENYYYDVLTFTSQEHHLEIRRKFVTAYTPFLLNEIEGSPMNGVIIPYDLSSSSYMSFSFWEDDDLLVIFYINRNKL
uniref:Uncharacterized protein n=1 Tax=Loa loa TaxID=7209 RepID=A0A1I7V7V3_LOALO